MKTWGVNDNQLTCGAMSNSTDGFSCGLWLIASDGNLLTNNGICES
jgi:hypothetical protein